MNIYEKFPTFVYESFELGFSWQVYKSIKADVRKSIGLSWLWTFVYTSKYILPTRTRSQSVNIIKLIQLKINFNINFLQWKRNDKVDGPQRNTRHSWRPWQMCRHRRGPPLLKRLINRDNNIISRLIDYRLGLGATHQSGRQTTDAETEIRVISEALLSPFHEFWYSLLLLTSLELRITVMLQCLIWTHLTGNIINCSHLNLKWKWNGS